MVVEGMDALSPLYHTQSLAVGQTMCAGWFYHLPIHLDRVNLLNFSFMPFLKGLR